MKILVVYATRHGSTREVAEAVTGTLRGCGAHMEFWAARHFRGSAGRFDLVVVGAPIYSGRWHRDAHRFLKRHRRELSTVPVAVFGMGPRRSDPEAWQRSGQQLDKALAKHGWLNPVAVTVFGGMDPPKHGKERRDLRNWAQIEAWASSLAEPAAWRAAPDRHPPGGGAQGVSGSAQGG